MTGKRDKAIAPVEIAGSVVFGYKEPYAAGLVGNENGSMNGICDHKCSEASVLLSARHRKAGKTHCRQPVLWEFGSISRRKMLCHDLAAEKKRKAYELPEMNCEIS